MNDDGIQVKLSEIEKRVEALEQRFSDAVDCSPEVVVGIKQDGLKLEFETKSLGVA